MRGTLDGTPAVVLGRPQPAARAGARRAFGNSCRSRLLVPKHAAEAGQLGGGARSRGESPRAFELWIEAEELASPELATGYLLPPDLFVSELRRAVRQPVVEDLLTRGLMPAHWRAYDDRWNGGWDDQPRDRDGTAHPARRTEQPCRSGELRRLALLEPGNDLADAGV